ncbi:hypothetical protein V2J09_019417 [Rumex salicifolius]
MNDRGNRDFTDDSGKGLIWRLPELRTNRLGKIGPAFAYGIGCGTGFGFGLIGGAGIGPGIPGLQLGFGVGVGCGVGVGFGYGVGKGVAYDENRKYSNIGRISQGLGNFPSQDELGAVVDEFLISTKKVINAASKEMDKWRR